MVEVSKKRKQNVLQHIYNVRYVKGNCLVKEKNLPIWIDDQQAAQCLTREGILSDDPNNHDRDCYRAGPLFRYGLRRYEIDIKDITLQRT